MAVERLFCFVLFCQKRKDTKRIEKEEREERKGVVRFAIFYSFFVFFFLDHVNDMVH